MFEKRSLETLVERQQGGGTPERDNPRFWNGAVPWASVKDFEDNQLVLNSTKESITQQGLAASSTNLIPAGTPLVCTRMAVGRCAISNNDVAINQDVKALFPKANVSPRYLLRLLDSLKFHVESVSVGSTVKGIRISDLLGIQAPIAPLYEQSKIAQILDTLDTQIQKTEALIAKLGKINEGLLHDLLTRGIDQSSHLRPMPEQAPELYKESAVGLIPKDWNVSNLGAASISSVIGPFGSDLVASDYRSEGVPVVFVRDIASARYNRASQVFLNQGKAQALSAHKVKAGDLLLTKMGLPPCISAIYPESEQAGIITADIVRLRLKNDVAPEWAHYYVNSEKVKSQVRGITAGVTRPKVTLKDVRGLRIAVPDIEEQARILNILQHSSNSVESEISSLAKLRAQKSGLMDDLLTGRVRVTPLLKDAV